MTVSVSRESAITGFAISDYTHETIKSVHKILSSYLSSQAFENVFVFQYFTKAQITDKITLLIRKFNQKLNQKGYHQRFFAVY